MSAVAAVEKKSSLKVIQPLYVEAKIGKYFVTSHWTDETSNKVVDFLTTQMLGGVDMNPPMEDHAIQITQDAKERMECRSPFSRFAILEQIVGGKAIALCTLGFDSDPRKMRIACKFHPDHQSEVAPLLLDLLFKEYLPMLREKGFLFPIYKPNQSQLPWPKKKFETEMSTYQVPIRILVHISNEKCNQMVDQFGFKKVDDPTAEAGHLVYELSEEQYIAAQQKKEDSKQ